MPGPTTRRRRLWTTLAASALLAPSAFPVAAAPSPDASASAAAQAPGRLAQDAGGEGGEGGGEGGEGGEGGVEADAAAEDPVAYLSALGVIAAHYLAGIEAYAAGMADEAAALFGHPIAEAYEPLEGVFAARGVVPFEDAMYAAVEAASAGGPADRVAAKARAVLDAVAAAEAGAPASDRRPAAIHGAVVAELIERAARQYAAASSAEPGDAYLDGYGLARAAAAAHARWGAGVDAASPDVAARMVAALAALARAYPTVAPPASPTATSGELLSASSRVGLSLGKL